MTPAIFLLFGLLLIALAWTGKARKIVEAALS